ncbi:MAG: 3-deoxy-7-phosphoheptulonate synthase [Firmicutes bacterium]|nr:3-deoxy-7-phosphoheptulonate synthase [Bacillota bacterium]
MAGNGRETPGLKVEIAETEGVRTQVRVGEVVFGAEALAVIAGPCAMESEEQYLEAAVAVAQAGGRCLRAAAFKPRTSPYSFQGLEREGLRLARMARQVTGLPVVTEVLDTRLVEEVAEAVDCLQIGARNMQNYELLKEVALSGRPVLLKRGLSATIEEWLLAAEYLFAGGNDQVILCERGIRTFETATRNTLDLNAVPVLRERTHLPVIVDPSHGTGRRSLVVPMARAAVAAGADGLIVEVHPDPDRALSDGFQSLSPQGFRDLMQAIEPVARAVGRSL